MPSLEILTYRALPNHLVTVKQAGVKESGSIEPSFETPTRACPMNLLRAGEELTEDIGGVCEYLIRLSSTDFDNLEDSGSRITEELSNVGPDASADEFSVGLIQYSGNSLFSIDAAKRLVQILSTNFDALVCPLMSAQIDGPDLNDNPENYNRFVENTESFLDAVKEFDGEILAFGTLPVVEWNRIEGQNGLMEILLEREVDGFCIDFLDKKPTAKSRIDGWISPFAERLGREGLHRESLLYAVNANRGKNRSESPGSPAEDFYAFGLGFDILGGRYYSAQTSWPADDVVRIRCFDSDSFEQQYVELDRLEAGLPDNTGLDHDYILDTVSDRDQRGRIQDLLEAEQMAIGYSDLRKAVQGNLGPEFIREKPGTIGRVESGMKTAKNTFDEGYSNPSFSNF